MSNTKQNVKWTSKNTWRHILCKNLRDTEGAQFYTTKQFSVDCSSGAKFGIHAWPYIRGEVGGREECEEWLIIGIIFSYQILGNYFFRRRGVFWKCLCENLSFHQVCVTCWNTFYQKLSEIFLADNKIHQFNLRFIKFRYNIFRRRFDICWQCK